MVILILFLVLVTVSLFIIGRVIYRKRQVDEVYQKLKQQLDDRNKQLTQLLLDHPSLTIHQPVLKTVKQLVQQASEDEPDMVEVIAIENRINQLFNKKTIQELTQYNETQTFYNIIVQSNLKLNQARETFNLAATYHNYSVEYFPTKILAKSLGYQTVVLLDQIVEHKEAIV